MFRRRKDKLGDRISKEVQSALEGYVTQEDIEERLKVIHSDETKKRLWDSLSHRKKVALLRRMKSGKR